MTELSIAFLETEQMKAIEDIHTKWQEFIESNKSAARQISEVMEAFERFQKSKE